MSAVPVEQLEKKMEQVQITRSPAIFIPDSFKGYPVSSFCLQHVPAQDLESVLIPGGLVRDRIERLGFDIAEDFTREDFTLLCVLKGGFQFFNELLQVMRQYHRFNADQSQTNIKNDKARRIQAEFIRLVSYEDDSSKGYVRIIGLENLSSLRDKNVLIVEDIIDSGLTMQTLLEALKKEKPKMIKVAALFFKRTPKNTGNYCPDYVGFSIPDSFIVGCNLDYNNYFRDLQHMVGGVPISLALHKHQLMATMIKLVLLTLLMVLVYLKIAQFASIVPEQPSTLLIEINGVPQADNSGRLVTPPPSFAPTTSSHNPTTTARNINLPSTTPSFNSTTTATTSTSTTTTTTIDPNSDLDDPLPQSPSTTLPPTQTPNNPNSGNNNNDKPAGGGDQGAATTQSPTSSKPNPNNNTAAKPIDNLAALDGGASNLDLSILFYSVFIVYVAFVKLLYHNVGIIRRNMTEQGILIIFGIIWGFIIRQTNLKLSVSPRFNPNIFFYLFLPSTVLESASSLSNKWLFFNLIPIILHSIIGTIMFVSALGFTMYSLSQQNVFSLNSLMPSNSSEQDGSFASNETMQLFSDRYVNYLDIFSSNQQQQQQQQQQSLFATTNSGDNTITISNLNNLTLSDCLIFSTILSAIDSTSMLNVLKSHQVNEKLYYLVLGESLMNNVVVLVLFGLLMDFFHATKLTVVKIYMAILQFFTTLIGSVFIGLLLAAIALVAVRLTKRFQVSYALSTYQNQCLAMVETLLIMKLAYLTYTIASLASTSNILSLATFGILENQYIKQNLNLRSQLTFRQIVLATKTMGYSLVYPLIGMLIVEVVNMGQFFRAWLSFDSSSYSVSAVLNNGLASNNLPLKEELGETRALNQRDSSLSNSMMMISAASVATTKLTNLASQANLNWNFKFISIVTILTIVYRSVIVIFLAIISNLIMSSQLNLRFKEQILMSLGGLKGPLTIALVYKLNNNQEYRDRTLIRSKHLFTSAILFMILVTNVIQGAFLRPLVAKIQSKLIGGGGGGGENKPLVGGGGGGGDDDDRKRSLELKADSTVLFDEINHKLCEHLSNGLNSILGRSRSPYDKFLEFNETHIKRWLTRDGSNTHWLAVFYDDLILNETLNSTCFYFATKDPTTMRTFDQEQSRRQLSQLHGEQLRHVESGSRHILDVEGAISRRSPAASLVGGATGDYRKHRINRVALLDEVGGVNPMGIINSRSNRNYRQNKISPAAGVGESLALNGDDRDQQPGVVPEKALLREYVMLNLRMQDEFNRQSSRKYPKSNHGRAHNSSQSLAQASDYHESGGKHLMKTNDYNRMLSTTSDEMMNDHLESGENLLGRQYEGDRGLLVDRIIRRIGVDGHQEAGEDGGRVDANEGPVSGGMPKSISKSKKREDHHRRKNEQHGRSKQYRRSMRK